MTDQEAISAMVGTKHLQTHPAPTHPMKIVVHSKQSQYLYTCHLNALFLKLPQTEVVSIKMWK